MVFGFGLKTTTQDLSYLIRRPGLLVRSLLAVFVVMPIVAVLLAVLFDFELTVERALIALAVSPVPPLLPRKESKAGGDEHYALGLMAILALLAIVVTPLEIMILQSVAGRPLEMAAGTVVRVVLISTLLPLGRWHVGACIHPRTGCPNRTADRTDRESVVTRGGGRTARRCGARPCSRSSDTAGSSSPCSFFWLSDSLSAMCSAGPIETTLWCSRCRQLAVIQRLLCQSQLRIFRRSISAPSSCFTCSFGAIVAVPYVARHRRQSRTALGPA